MILRLAKTRKMYPKRLINDLYAGNKTSATASLKDSLNSESGTVHWDCLWWSSSNWPLKSFNLIPPHFNLLSTKFFKIFLNCLKKLKTNLSFTSAREAPLLFPPSPPPTEPPPPDELKPWIVRHWRIYWRKQLKKFIIFYVIIDV